MKRLSIADIKATEILSTEEKKMVVGGSPDHFTGTGGQCNGAGTWKYKEAVSTLQIEIDIRKYCKNGGHPTGIR
jgi:hypothetical protein